MHELVAHSVLSAEYLAAEVSQRYDVAGPVKAFLLYRGMNDVYIIQAQDRRYALRVWRKTWRPVDVVADELDFLMQDVQNYVWGNLFYGFDSAYGEAFERGYAGVRPYTEDEIRNKELFLLAKTFRLVAGMAHSSASVGRGTLRFRSMDWLGHYLRERARPLGLLP